MELYLDRAWKKDTYTIGTLFIGNKKFSDTLEDTDRGLDNSMTLAEIQKIKVYGETAIPAGKYEIRLTQSDRFAKKEWARMTQGKIPELIGVPGFSRVRIHPGNSNKDTLGCILVGANTKKGWVSRSQTTYYDLVLNHLLPAVRKNEKIWITIM